MVIAFRRANKQASQIPGFLRSSLLLESPVVCQILEIWSKSSRLTQQPGIGPPVSISQAVLANLGRRQTGRTESQSREWDLSSASRNLNWADFDFRAAISEATRGSDEQ
jgi:hypothetical protein